MRDLRQTSFLCLVLLWPTLATWVYFVLLADQPGVGTAYGLSKVVQAALPLVGWYFLGFARPATERPRRDGLGLGLATGVLLGLPILVAYFGWLENSPLLADAPRQIASRLEAVGANSPLGFVVVGLVLSCLHSWFEEYYWRWFLYGALRERVGLRWAMILSSLGFASHHFLVIDRFLGGEHLWTATIPFGLGVALGGAVWCVLFQRSRSLTPGWLSHALVDAAIMIVGYSILWP